MGASLRVRLYPEAPERRDASGGAGSGCRNVHQERARSGPRGAGLRDDQSATQRENPGGAVSARPRQIDSERVVVGSARAGGRTQIIWFCVLSAVRRAVAILGRRAVRQLFDRPRQRLRHRLAQLERRTA